MEPIEPLPEPSPPPRSRPPALRQADRGEHPPRRAGPRRGRAQRARRAARRGPHPRRGLPGRRQDRAGPRAGAQSSTASSRACSARPTCCRPTSSARTSSTSARRASSSGPARSSPTSSSSTRSTARRRRRSPACSSACRSATSPSTSTRTSSPGRSWSSRRRTRSSTRAPTRCPRPRSTASWSGSRWATRRRTPRRTCSPATRAATACSSSRPVVDRAEVLDAQDAARRVHASKALRDYIVALLAPHARGRARRARRLAARRPDAAARRQGARAHQRPRPRAARRRPGARPDRCSSHRIMLVPEAAGSTREEVVADAVAGDAGALRRRPCAPPPAARALGSLLLLVAGTFDAEPFYVTGAALALLGAGAAAGSAPAPGARPSTASWAPQRDGGRAADAARRGARRRGCRCRPATSTSRCSPRRRRCAAGARRAAGRASRRPSPAAGAATLAPPALVLRDPLGLAERVVRAARGRRGARAAAHPSGRAPRPGGGEDTGAHARALLTAAAETEIDGLRQHVEGSPASRIHWPSVAKGGEIMERKLIAEADSRPLVVLDPRGAADARGPRRGGPRRRARCAVHFAARDGCALLLPGDRRAVDGRARPPRLARRPRAARAARGDARPGARAPPRTAAA